MNKSLLIRNLIVLKRNYLQYLAIVMITPMILYLFNILPYSDGIAKIWSSVGLWISSCVICSYIYIYQNISKYRSNKIFLVTTPISFRNLLFSNVIICVLLVFFQLIVSYLLTFSLNNVSLSILDFGLFFVNILPIILLSISAALLIALFDNLNIGLFICTLIALSITQFFYLFPSFQSIDYDYIPIIGLLLNCASLFNNGSPQFLPLILMYIISGLCLIVSLIVSAKIIEGENEK